MVKEATPITMKTDKRGMGGEFSGLQSWSLNPIMPIQESKNPWEAKTLKVIQSFNLKIV